MKNQGYQKPTKTQHAVGAAPKRKHRTRYVWLNVLPDDLWLKVRRGDTIWEALQKEDVELAGDCGGLGKCGKCKVRVLTSIAYPSPEEAQFLDEDEINQGIRLACRTKVNKDLVVHLGDTDPDATYFQILKTGHQPLLHLEPLIEKRFVPLSPDPNRCP